MKFNWRANWEILLVLVIIVVGIVITTIAAIKNKDNHPLTLPEETDFRQLLATNGDSGTYPDSTNNSNSHQHDLHNSNNDLDEDNPMIGNGIVGASRGSPGANHVKPTQSSRYQQQQHQQNHHSHDDRQAKYDDGAEYNKPNIDQQVVTTSSARFTAGDSYEPMSTEPTPNQVRAQSDYNSGVINHPHPHAHHTYYNQNIAPKSPYHHTPRQFSSSRRHVNRTTAATQLNADDVNVGGVTNHQPGHYNDPLGDSVDLIDDIHTTRSSLVGTNQHSSNEANQSNNKNQNQQLGGGSGVGGSSQLDQNQLTPLSSLTLHGPYGSMPASMNNLLLHNTNHKLETSGSLIEPDDMTNSYSRLPSLSSSTVSNNLTDSLFNDYNLAATIGNSLNSNSNSTQQQQQQQLLSSAMLANLLGTVPNSNNQDSSSVTSSNAPDIFNQQQQQQTTTPTPTHHRAFSSLLPISVLLTDLLKLTRPHASSSSSLNEQQNRPSILQQSRLPTSFLNLLQGITAPNNGAITNTNYPDLNSYINHDASESSQHYHRVSMSPTDIHSILARSLGSSGVLPAFPAPKGVPQTWIPPTSGGNPDYNSAFNSNADFVAGNVAGFVRPPPVLTSTSEQVSHQYNNNNQQPTMDTSYQRQSVGNTDLPSNSQIDNVQQQQQQQPQFQQGSSFANIDDLQSQQVFQSTAGSGGLNNEQRSWQVRSSNGPVSFQNNQNFQNNILRQTTTGGANEMDNVRRVFKTNAAPISMAQTSGNQQNSASNGAGFNAGVMLGGNDIQISQQQSFNQQQPKSAFNQNSPSEIQVPLGYSPTQQNSSPLSNMNQINQQQPRIQTPPQLPHNIQQIRAAFESSSPSKQISVNSMQQASNIKPQIVMNQANQQQQQQQQQQVLRNQQQPLVSMPNRMQTKTNRRKRAVKSNDMDRVDEYMSSKYGGSDDDEEDDGDLRPISVVSPDGKPMNSGRVRSSSIWRGDNNSPDSSITNDENSKLLVKNKKNNERSMNDRQVAQSQRSANHLDSMTGSRRFNRDRNNNILHPSSSSEGHADDHRQQSNRRQRFRLQNGLQEDSMVPVDETVDEKSPQDRRKGESNRNSPRSSKNATPLDAAGSGLMSKLLGTASTNDELEEELDDDDDPTNEKKKEDIEDAEFGIVNDERQNNHQDVMRGLGVVGGSDGGGGGGGNQLGDHLNKQMQPGSSVESGLGSGSTDNESYMRRNQQRSDIEFYGHPGEETRTLKYGILGSGNYEVVDGGIYPEADESTAAVNSVANYVRKPGALLTNLPKLLSEQVVNTQTSFMPGGRVGSFLRGASTNPNDMVGGLIATDLGANKDPLSNPLLELIDANGGQLFDPNILSQIGSSGSSARTTHTGKELIDSTNQDRDNSLKQRNKHKKGIKHYKINKMKNGKSNFANDGEQYNDLENLDQVDENNGDDEQQQQQTTTRLKGNTRNNEFNSGQLQQQQSSISGSRSQGTNQFNSYQILPSKKVTIFSDQDLDSAPSERKFAPPLISKFPLEDYKTILRYN